MDTNVRQNPTIEIITIVRPVHLIALFVINSKKYTAQTTSVIISFGSEYEKLSIVFGSHAYPTSITTLRSANPRMIDR